MYVCPNCGRDVEEIPKLAVRCPYCGYRILLKKRQPVVKLVKAR